jgi:tricorn protease
VGGGPQPARYGQIVYSPLYRDFRPEKRYGGGMANDLFIFDLASNTARRVINDVRSDRDPIWFGGTIYFNSDRSGTFNLYAYDVARARPARSPRAVWDVRWPSGDRHRPIVYELNARSSSSTPTGRAARLHHGAG